MQSIIKKQFILNLVTIKIISLIIGFSAIGACLKLAFNDKMVKKNYKSDIILQKSYISKSDTAILQNNATEASKLAGKKFLIEQNIILFY
jgi:hypothetical protein